MSYHSIRIVRGTGGFGGPLVITPTEENTNSFILLVGEKSQQSSIKLLN
ncbi:hypothetical protein IGJ99_001849 [Enterococcus sp. AZ095b]